MVFKQNRFRGRKQAHARKKKALVGCNSLVILRVQGKKKVPSVAVWTFLTEENCFV